MSAWIKVEQSLFTHRKLMVLAETLEIEEVAAVGHLAALWAWALDNAPDGVLPDSDRIVARAAMWKGPATMFVRAIIFAGFADDNFQDTGNRSLHDWEHYAGNLMRKRALGASRVRKFREAHKGEAQVSNRAEPVRVPDRFGPDDFDELEIDS